MNARQSGNWVRRLGVWIPGQARDDRGGRLAFPFNQSSPRKRGSIAAALMLEMTLLQPHARTAAVFGDELDTRFFKTFFHGFHGVQGTRIDVLPGFEAADRRRCNIGCVGKLADAPAKR